MDYQKRLYLILYPAQALVASQLDAEQFGKHYQVSSHRHHEGKVIFCSVDATYRHPFFDIDGAFRQLQAHEDGRPKATKYICSYRSLEHIDYKSIFELHVMTANGNFLTLQAREYNKTHEPGHLRCFAQICPLNMLVITTLNAEEYSKYITTPGHALGAPRLFFTQVEFPTEDFLADFEKNPFTPSPIAFVHPAKLRAAIMEVKNSKGGKIVKGVSIKSDLERFSYSRIRHGFWLASQEKMLFFPMPSPTDLMRDNYQFYRSM
jgi:hypothetical protein